MLGEKDESILGRFKEKINNLGVVGFVMLVALQIAQILFIVIPGEPLEILAGMCYGGLWGTIFILVSVFVTSYIIIFLVKKYGKGYIYHFFKKDKIDKIENSKFFKNQRKMEIILTILYIIPGTPKDLLTYVCGLLPMSTLKLVIISTIARIPSIVSSTIAGGNLVEGDWKISILIYAITFAITFLFIFIIKKVDKNKIIEDATNSLK